MTLDNDPTAHAEVNAIRQACSRLATFNLKGCDIYCSCEPCPMCFGAIYWARIDNIYYSNNRKDAARIGFSDDFIEALGHEQFGRIWGEHTCGKQIHILVQMLFYDNVGNAHAAFFISQQGGEAVALETSAQRALAYVCVDEQDTLAGHTEDDSHVLRNEALAV